MSFSASNVHALQCAQPLMLPRNIKTSFPKIYTKSVSPFVHKAIHTLACIITFLSHIALQMCQNWRMHAHVLYCLSAVLAVVLTACNWHTFWHGYIAAYLLAACHCHKCMHTHLLSVDNSSQQRVCTKLTGLVACLGLVSQQRLCRLDTKLMYGLCSSLGTRVTAASVPPRH